MSTDLTASTVRPPGDRRAEPLSRGTRALLTGGAVAGPLFVLTIAVQAVTRDGFDPRRHPLSMLSLGDAGWVQTTNFLLTGLLVLGSAAGLRRALGGQGVGRTWGPLLIGTYGLSLIWAGVFATDPADGFPIGTPTGIPPELSWHAQLHNLAPVGMGLALSLACFVLARRFARQGRHGWALYSVLAALTYLVVGSAAFPAGDYRLMLVGGAAIWTWASAVSLEARRTE